MLLCSAGRTVQYDLWTSRAASTQGILLGNDARTTAEAPYELSSSISVYVLNLCYTCDIPRKEYLLISIQISTHMTSWEEQVYYLFNNPKDF